MKRLVIIMATILPVAQFRGEAFNLTNTPQFDRPDTVLTDAAFGQVTTAHGTQSVQMNNNRQLQFSLRLLF